MEDEERHLHIAVLTQGSVRWELANYLLHIALDPAARYGRELSIKYYPGKGMEGRPVSSNRNRIVRDRPAGCDLLMLDQDVVPHYKLLEITVQGLDIVVCPVPIWRPNDPGDCPVRVNMDAQGDRVMELGAAVYDRVTAGGTGAIYISHRVLDHPGMRAPFQFQLDEDGVNWRGEDYSFCDRARAAGFEIHSANEMLCSHYHSVDLLSVMQRWYEMMESADAGQVRAP